MVLVLFWLLSCLSLCSSVSPSLGVIRWDAYNQINGNYTSISIWSYIELLPIQFHYRLPYYTIVSSNNQNISFNEQNQSIIDDEILYASNANINYWSFVTYSPNTYMTYALDLYLSSKYNNLINFTMIWQGNYICDETTVYEYFIPYLTQNPNNYEYVLNKRPLIYLFSLTSNSCNNNLTLTLQIINNIRNTIIINGFENPYLVILDGSINEAIETMNNLKLDGISTYAYNGGKGPNSPFSELVTMMNSWWDQVLQNNVSMITPIPLGWDPRPRNLNPPPWVPNGEGNTWFNYPNKTELISYLQNGFSFTCNNRNGITNSLSLLMYAWDEFSENGCNVCPTIGNGTFIVDVLQSILPYNC